MDPRTVPAALIYHISSFAVDDATVALLRNVSKFFNDSINSAPLHSINKRYPLSCTVKYGEYLECRKSFLKPPEEKTAPTVAANILAITLATRSPELLDIALNCDWFVAQVTQSALLTARLNQAERAVVSGLSDSIYLSNRSKFLALDSATAFVIADEKEAKRERDPVKESFVALSNFAKGSILFANNDTARLHQIRRFITLAELCKTRKDSEGRFALASAFYDLQKLPFICDLVNNNLSAAEVEKIENLINELPTYMQFKFKKEVKPSDAEVPMLAAYHQALFKVSVHSAPNTAMRETLLQQLASNLQKEQDALRAINVSLLTALPTFEDMLQASVLHYTDAALKVREGVLADRFSVRGPAALSA